MSIGMSSTVISCDMESLSRAMRRESVDGHAHRVMCERFELVRIVRAYDLHRVCRLSLELSQSSLVCNARLAVLLHHPLIEAQARRAVRPFDVHFRVIEVGVARL